MAERLGAVFVVHSKSDDWHVRICDGIYEVLADLGVHFFQYGSWTWDVPTRRRLVPDPVRHAKLGQPFRVHEDCEVDLIALGQVFDQSDVIVVLSPTRGFVSDGIRQECDLIGNRLIDTAGHKGAPLVLGVSWPEATERPDLPCHVWIRLEGDDRSSWHGKAKDWRASIFDGICLGLIIRRLQFDFGRVIGQYLLALGASSDIVREWSRQSPGHLPLDFDALAAENADLVAAQQAGPPNGMDEITKLFWESDFAIARHDAGALLNWWATSLEPLKVRFRDGSGRSLAAAGCYLIELVDANVARACERFSLVTRS